MIPPDAEPHYPRLATYADRGNDRGRGRLWQVAWTLVHGLFFTSWWFPRRLRPPILRLFGAKIGTGVIIRHRVRVTWPWKLVIGDNSWIGEDCWLHTAGHITIGSDVCLSQGVFLCPGDHDHSASDFPVRLGHIRVEDGAWLALQSLVLRDVTIGKGAIVGGRAIAARDVPPGGIVRLGQVN